MNTGSAVVAQTTPRRPDRTVVVTGTGTEVGKTWVSAHLLTELIRAGVTCVARKPAQSFDLGDAAAHDADVLAEATGEDPGAVCPVHRNYAVAMAPPMAADVLGEGPILVSDLISELDQSWPDPEPQLALVELAGGVRSPIAKNAHCGEFTAMVEPTHVVLVADAGLGTINAVMSALDSLTVAGGGHGKAGVVTTGAGGHTAVDLVGRTTVYLNRYDESDDLHRRNRAWLESSGCGPIPVTPTALAELLAPNC